MVDGHIGPQPGSLANPAILTDVAARPNQYAITQHHAGFDDCIGANCHPLTQLNIRGNHSAGVNTGCGFRRGVQQLGNSRKPHVGILDDQRIGLTGSQVRRLEQHGTRLSLTQEGVVLAIG